MVRETITRCAHAAQWHLPLPDHDPMMPRPHVFTFARFAAAAVTAVALAVHAQIPPSPAELERYRGVFSAAARGDAAALRTATRSDVEARDSYGRTALIVAAHARQREAMRALVAAGANPNALENDRYDIVTIAAVANDLETLKVALSLGASPANVTSRYDGTALIAAAHLGHAAVVRELCVAGAPLDHVNESIVLGDGGPRHVDTLRTLVQAGANVNIADRGGTSPLALARGRGYREMVSILEAAGAR
jgi:ankyrin repeat protein